MPNRQDTANAPRDGRAKDQAPALGATADAEEIRHFDGLAAQWWDEAGPMRPLHTLNPIRLGYIRDRLGSLMDRPKSDLRPLAGLRVLDVGCGGGLVAEPLARLGAAVTGLDGAGEAIAAARAHAATAGVEVDYRQGDIIEVAASGVRYDAVLALEVVEHVADREAFLKACGSVVRPGGKFIASTLNRSGRSFALAIVGAEYVMGWLPRGTHDWHKFVRPAELARTLRQTGLLIGDVTGLGFSPLTGRWRLTADCAVNYIMTATKA